MGRNITCFSFPEFALVFAVLAVLLFPSSNGQLQYSEVQTLFSVQRILEYPSALSGWSNRSNFCSDFQSSSLTIVCSGASVIELSIVGNKGASSGSKLLQDFSVSDQTLSSEFSIDSLFATLSQLPSLKSLSLVSLGLWGTLPTRISLLLSLQVLNVSSNFLYGYIPMRVSLLRSLQTLALDNNMFYGHVPRWVNSLNSLSVLNLGNNALNGSLPSTLGTSKNLKVLILSTNRLSGGVPNLSGLVNLEVLDLGDNLLGPKFPALGNNLVKLSLQRNLFTYNIPSQLASFDRLESFDISHNRFVGPILLPLFSLPSIQYLNLSGNKLTGLLPVHMKCNAKLQFVDISNNLLTGVLPTCLRNSSSTTVSYSGNCLNNTSKYQHQYSFCSNPALAAIPPPIKKKTSSNKLILLLGVAGGIVVGAVIIGFLMLVLVRQCKAPNSRQQKTKVITASAGFPPRLLSNSKYISHTMRLGPLGLPPYRIFTLEEIEEATDNFDKSNLMGEGSQGQIYRGRLGNGSLVAVRSFRLKEKHTLESLMQYIEPLTKLRHRHLVSILGHCIVCYMDSQNVEMVYLIFEFISNGPLSSLIYDGRQGDMLSWPERVGIAMGITRGVKFLHTGVVPGVFGNDLKAENILLDHNLTPKISKYNLPMPSKSMAVKVGSGPLNVSEAALQPASIEQGEKSDIYRLGIVMLELIIGRHINTQNELDALKNQISSTTDAERLREAIDPSIHHSCSHASLRTMIDIAVKCLSEETSERPSVEDVIWHLQYSAQVQDGLATNSNVEDYLDLHI
ncbi:putative inactive leucine-rich repeat receptor-like protein kinase [Nymphaea thermarum]|nr:putative inactive leucine-rich repeat receptor-like protein kinase [Nymphaea thermarum]